MIDINIVIGLRDHVVNIVKQLIVKFKEYIIRNVSKNEDSDSHCNSNNIYY